MSTPEPAPRILGIETAVPETFYTQEFALKFLKALPFYGEEASQRFLERIYQGSAIDKRHTVIDDYGKQPAEFRFYPPSSDLRPEPSPERRNDLFIREAERLSLRASRDLLEGLPRFDRRRISHVVTVSCTGFSAPGFDFSLVRDLGLSNGVHRFHLGFMGCYAALPALKLATSICRSEPEARVLVVTVELCSLHFQQRLEKDIMVATSLFSDGVAAALVSSRAEEGNDHGLSLEAFASRIIPGSEREMAWKLGDRAFDMRLSVYVPRLIRDNIGPALESLCREMGVERGAVSFWAIHPGGRAILDRVAETLGLGPEELSESYGVLREYGNMSSSTILFVLKRMLEGPGTGNVFAAAFGPGLTLESALLRKLDDRSP